MNLPEMPLRIFVPRDSSALALGANAVAEAIMWEAQKRGVRIELVRNGSRGLLWLEPLVEMQTPAGRVGYGNVQAADVGSLFDAWVSGGAHARSVGLVEEISYLKRQQRLTFARLGITDPLSIEDYVAHEGLAGPSSSLAARPSIATSAWAARAAHCRSSWPATSSTADSSSSPSA